MAEDLQLHVTAFGKKLDSIVPEHLGLQGYPLDYLQVLLSNKKYYLHIYAAVLKQVQVNFGKNIDQITLVDYGAGNGLLGLFAKFCGFGSVYLLDSSTLFIDAAKTLATALAIPIDGFIIGDEQTLKQNFTGSIQPDAIVGTDVIEHIYDLDRFFSTLQKLNSHVVTVFTTASVTGNPIKNRQLKKLQYQDEYVGSNASHAQPNDAYAGMPFYQIRKQIILKEHSTIDLKQLEELATATRGMMKKDILHAVDTFLAEGAMPVKPAHPTNTCDPTSGSWTERLLTIEEYKTIYQRAGFKVSIYNGFYNEWQHGLKSLALRSANKLIKLMGKGGKVIAPFILLVGKKG